MTASQPSARAAYKKLKERFDILAGIENAGGVLQKEMETTMPKGASKDRAHTITALAMASHGIISDPKTEALLKQAMAGKKDLPREDQRNLELMHHDWVHNAALPEDIVREQAWLSSTGEQLHSKFRTTGKWDTMKDVYVRSFNCARAAGEAKKDMLGVTSAYEALLDQFSPGLREETVATEFAKLEKALAPMIAAAVKKQKGEKVLPLPKTTFAQQEELCNRVAKAMGFDYKRGRFDLTRDHHPSSGGTSDDARITARYEEDDFLVGLYAAIHEAGHAMYDQNQPKKWRYQPAGGHLGMAVHESQSMIWELQAGLSPEFFQYLEKEARKVFNLPDDPALSAQNLQRHLTRVKPSFIRIESDELTYPAHIVLRWRLEKSIIEGKLKAEDLPKAWNDGMKKLLGITPPNNAKGCMQDVHWPGGMQGYFPSYTLGAMGAAQLFAAACKARPELRGEIARGNFKPLKEWLRDNVHSKGSLVTPDELFRQATGETLNARYYLNHLSQRYLGQPWAEAPAERNKRAPRP